MAKVIKCSPLHFNNDGQLSDRVDETNLLSDIRTHGITDLILFVHGLNATENFCSEYITTLQKAAELVDASPSDMVMGACAVVWDANGPLKLLLAELQARAAKIATTGLTEVLQKLLRERGALRLHISGHSTGTVLAASVPGPKLCIGSTVAVKSLFLIQGIPWDDDFAPGTGFSEGMRFVDGPIIATVTAGDDMLRYLELLVLGLKGPIGRRGLSSVNALAINVGPAGTEYNFKQNKFFNLNIKPAVGDDHDVFRFKQDVAWTHLVAANFIHNRTLRQLGAAAWANTLAMTSLNGALYAIQSGKLWRANPEDGQFEQLGGEYWHNTAAMTSLNGALYAIQSGKLWRANPQNGQFEQLGGEYWHNTAAMTSLNGALYAVQNGKLWRANPESGNFEQLGGEHWHNTAAMTSLNGALYAVQNGKLWRADPESGRFEQLGERNWNNSPDNTTVLTAVIATALNRTSKITMTAGADGKLYIIQGNALWQVDPNTGASAGLYDGFWRAPCAMTSLDRFLYIIDDNKLWQVALKGQVL